MEIPENKKQFEITEKFIGWGSAYVWAETKEEAMNFYRSGDYKDSDYDVDDMTYDHEFVGITAEDEIVESTPEVF